MHTQVPLKRVNQAYVIATSTKVDIKGADVRKLEDSHFKAAEKPREKKSEDGFFKKDTETEEKVRTMQSQLVIVSWHPIRSGEIAQRRGEQQLIRAGD
jgi:ribosomal protein L14E/L6E/L27E